MKNNFIDKAMQIYFKYIGISNIILYTIYFIKENENTIGLREIIFITIASISMVLIPILYLVIMTKRENLQNIQMHLNIIITTICFDILLLSLGSEFSFTYLIKSIVVSMILLTPIRIFISSIISFIISIPKKLLLNNTSN